MTGLPATLRKEERICSKKDISRLVSKGKYGFAGCLRYCVVVGNGLEYSRILVSVPKRSFKRAVKRNLLKRRMRESYRHLKGLLEGCPCDIMFNYISREVLPYSEILGNMEEALKACAAKYAKK